MQMACLVGGASPTPTPQATPVSLDALRFADPEAEMRFRALDACIRDMQTDDWRTTGYHTTGNFFTSRWCQGSGAREDCQDTFVSATRPDQHLLELSTLFYPADFPEVFGLGLYATWIPKDGGWAARFYYSEGGKTVQGEGVGVLFEKFAPGQNGAVARVALMGSLDYKIFETSLELPRADTSLDQELRRFMASPEALRDEGLTQIQALSEQVDAALRSNQVTACDRGEYQNDGIPPACTPRPLTPEELTAELARATAAFSEQQSLLREAYQEMYAAWMKAFPLDRCWP